MRTLNQLAVVLGIGAGFLAYTAFVVSPASAEDVPRSYVASPDVYKVIADNRRARLGS